MALMCGGLVLFLIVHLIPQQQMLRRDLMKRYGAGSYRGVISALSLLALTLVVWGKADAAFTPVWYPPPVFRHITFAAMPVALALLCASFIHCNIRRFVLHPMLSAVSLWALAHLLSNGDLASIILFGFFLLFSVYKQWLLRRRWPDLYYPPAHWSKDLLVGAIGIGLTALLVYGHGKLFGVPLMTL
jgi:uncharacterized membrane protein